MASIEATLPSVVIPAFNAPQELDGCLESVAASTPAGTEVVVIDDASTDPATREVLADWRRRAHGGWRFLANQRNLGFVATANRGMRETAGDVVLLNADTVVTEGWLVGLGRCLAADAAIATATPWTNNGEIASLPRFCAVNPPPAHCAAFAEDLQETLPDRVVVTGGLAADGQRFQRTWVLHNGLPSDRHVAAVGLYGDAVRVTHGCEGGWREFGPARRITRSSWGRFRAFRCTSRTNWSCRPAHPPRWPRSKRLRSTTSRRRVAGSRSSGR